MTELRQTCLNRNEGRISLLESKIYSTKLTNYGDVHSFLSSLRTTLVDLTNQQVPLSDREKLTILINALPPSFQVFGKNFWTTRVKITALQKCVTMNNYTTIIL